jgi:uridine phosphorylase
MGDTAERKYHVGLLAEEVGKYVLYPGDPARTAVVAKFLDGAREVAFNREYRTFTGTLAGTPVSAISSGMGGPSVAIGMEELRELGVHTFLRVGTCGATQPEIKLGDLVIATGAVRTEGTGDGYVPKEFPAVANYSVVTALLESAREMDAPHHLGIVRAVDALYSDLVPDTMPDAAGLRAELAIWARAGVLANDMETSTLFVVGSVRRLRAGSLLLCVDEVGAGEIEHVDPSYMERMLRVAVGAIRRLVESDAAHQ